jgi:hypothetical protein
LEIGVARLSNVNSNRFNPIWARLVKSDSVSLKFKGLKLRFFWLVVFWTDLKPTPVFA